MTSQKAFHTSVIVRLTTDGWNQTKVKFPFQATRTLLVFNNATFLRLAAFCQVMLPALYQQTTFTFFTLSACFISIRIYCISLYKPSHFFSCAEKGQTRSRRQQVYNSITPFWWFTLTHLSTILSILPYYLFITHAISLLCFIQEFAI